MYIYIYVYIYIYTHIMYICIYTYDYIYNHMYILQAYKRGSGDNLTVLMVQFEWAAPLAAPAKTEGDHRWNRNPRPQAEKFSN